MDVERNRAVASLLNQREHIVIPDDNNFVSETSLNFLNFFSHFGRTI